MNQQQQQQQQELKLKLQELITLYYDNIKNINRWKGYDYYIKKLIEQNEEIIKLINNLNCHTLFRFNFYITIPDTTESKRIEEINELIWLYNSNCRELNKGPQTMNPCENIYRKLLINDCNDICEKINKFNLDTQFRYILCW